MPPLKSSSLRNLEAIHVVVTRVGHGRRSEADLKKVAVELRWQVINIDERPSLADNGLDVYKPAAFRGTVG